MNLIRLHRYERFCANQRTVLVNPACIALLETIDSDPGRKPEYTRIELISGTPLTVTETPDKVLEEIHFGDVANASLLERN